VGQGYVGLPLAIRAVEVGHDVVGLEIDGRRAKRLATGESYVEDISSEQLAAALATGRYQPTVEGKACAGFDVAVITVPTPLREGNPDLSYIESAATTLGRFLRPGATVILESTTYPGTTEELVGPILEEASGLATGPTRPRSCQG
jgi:UDP-N-acetyl-D-glucosamine dehydrogenase